MIVSASSKVPVGDYISRPINRWLCLTAVP